MKIHRLALQALALLAVNQKLAFDGRARSGIMLAIADDAGDTDEAAAVDPIDDEKDATTPEAYKPPPNAENYQFQAEVHRMLDIVVNSLYQNKDVFLRELISNASDALDKFRYLTLTQGDKYKDGGDVPLKIELDYDKDAGTLTIRDTGVGMTHDEMVENLGTVARSGTTKFLEALKESGGNDGGGVDQIGQFGVGFYSAFLVADRVTVASKSPLSDDQNIWESVNGESEFHIYPDPRGKTLARGTEITLHLKEDSKNYARFDKIEELVKHYSEFVVHPIYIKRVTEEDVEDEDAEQEEKPERKEGEEDLEVEDEDEQEKPKKMKKVTVEKWDEVNTKQALWTRPAEEITDDEYQSFWHNLNGNEYSNATFWTHFNAEGNINFKSLMYMPSEIPPELRSGSMDQIKSGIRLYVRKVLISDSFDLMPRYLSFIKGVVDSDDLPLNVNRETLQESKIIAIIKKKLVRKALDMVKDFSKKKAKSDTDEPEAEAEIGADGTVKEAEKKDKKEDEFPYIDWYKKFSTSLKLGLLEDSPNRKRIMKLLRFQTLKSNGKYISLDEYVENMKEWQDVIYTLAGSDVESIKKSPFLAPFAEKDVDCLLFDEPIDEYWSAQVKDYENTKFSDVSRENVKFRDEDEDLVKRREKAYKEKFKPLTKWLKKLYGSSIMRVALSSRLGSSPAIVSSTQWGNSANMERILRAQTLTHDISAPSMSMKILEINPRHPLVLKLLEGSPAEDAEDAIVAPEVEDAAWVMHDLAMMHGGYPITDPVGHATRMTKFMQSTLGVESLALEPEIDPPEEEEEAPELDMDGMGGINMEDFDLGDMDLD